MLRMVPLPILGRIAAFIAALLPLPALADTPVVISAAPDKVAVTIYRDPNRGENPIYKASPGAFALITETRTIDLPPGVVTVRFEGVAGGIVPKSAILFGTDPRERNRDAALLSQKGLVDGFTGQGVILKRTDPATGKVTEERATIRSAANRLVVTTARGTEAMYCSGLNQTLVYGGVPNGLSAKPVLSMTTKDQPGGRTTVTLAYIATGFDWDATYVATLSDKGDALEVLAWLTMASGDETSFPDADTAAVAGKVNRTDKTRDNTGAQARAEAESLNKWSDCWPADTTTDGLDEPPYPMSSPPPPPPAPLAVGMMMESDSIVVSARKSAAPALIAKTEDLGDLKLYTIPLPVTVAARSQKQVAFLTADKVQGSLLYRSIVNGDPSDPQQLFRFKNRKLDGLGKALPAGKVVLYQGSRWGTQLIGEAKMDDKAIDEEVELVFGQPTGVTMESTNTGNEKSGWSSQTVVLRNANPFAVTYELEFPNGDIVYRGLPGKMVNKPGKKVWVLTLGPGSETQLNWDFRTLET